MMLSTIHCGDEVFHDGEPHIALRDGKRTGVRGEAATLADVDLIPTRFAGIAEDGVLEFGIKGHAVRHVPDIDVQVLRSGVHYRSSALRSETAEDGRLIPVHTGYSAAECVRTELVRYTLKRVEIGLQADEVNGWFREYIRRGLKHGMSVAEIREVTGLSRERIYQIRDGRR